MNFTETKLKGAFEIEIKKLKDDRGFFGRSLCRKEMAEHNLNGNVVQANTSYTKTRGTLRGMHYQNDPYQETKLMKCVKGAIFDVIIDLRPLSSTYLQWFGIELNDKNFKMLYVPENFANGFITLTDEVVVNYSVSQYYTPGSETGIRWNDPLFNIDWPLDVKVISSKDAEHKDYKAKI